MLRQDTLEDYKLPENGDGTSQDVNERILQ